MTLFTNTDHIVRFVLLSLTCALTLGRIVTVPEGPLIRVEGQDISIPCEVNDYEGPREQDFEWKVMKGGNEVQIISTFDSSYSDSSYAARVRNKDITVDRTGDNTVVLKIKRVTSDDSAFYSCITPSTDSSVKGNYDASIQVLVIPESLKIISPQTSKTVPEGSSFKLLCTATIDFVEHTYLSVSWAIKRGSSSQTILTFGPDESMKSESSYSERYADGSVRLDLAGKGQFDLIVSQALPSDEGVYMCSASEWVKERGGNWEKIFGNSTEVGEVKVTPTAQSLMVTVAPNATLNTDDTLHLTCTTETNNYDVLGMEVSWFASATPSSVPGSARLLVHMSRDAVVNGSDLLSVSRISPNAFKLDIHNVDSSDSEYYFCQVVAWMQQSPGKWYKVAEKTSNAVNVIVTSLEPSYDVTLQAVQTPSFSDQPTELECKLIDVKNAKGVRMTVAWNYRKITLGDMPVVIEMIASMNENWDLQTGEKYKDRVDKGHIVLSKVKPDSFKLQILHTRDTDRGDYFCTVTAWTQSRDGSWKKSKDVNSSNVRINWTQQSPKIAVVAVPMKVAFSGGDTFEMSCNVTGENLQSPLYSTLIKVEESVGGKVRKIISLSRDSVLQLEEWNDKDRLDSVVLEKTSQHEYRFRMYGTQISDTGFYFCEVTAWTPDAGNTWSPATTKSSNKVKVAFDDAGPVFNVSIHSDTLSVFPEETTKIDCVISAVGAASNKDDFSYEVAWFLDQTRYKEGSVHNMALVDRWGVVKKPHPNGSSDCSLERIDEKKYRLSIHKTQNSDFGDYYCTVTPWVKSSDGSWQKSKDITSENVFLVVKFAMWESMKLPLLYGAGAAVAVGLLSVLIGFISARCCCKQDVEDDPRSKRRLMSMEMD
ncbi:FPRP regulator, partial [Amia calva]|nr:FPRP regulator [Amia calva]